MTAALEAARAAVPAPAQGWINTLNDDSVSPPTSFCPDFYPWTYRYGRNYSRVEGAEERERAVAAAGARRRGGRDVGARIDPRRTAGGVATPQAPPLQGEALP